MLGILRYLFNPNEKQLRKYREIVKEINEYEADIMQLDDETLRSRTEIFKKRLENGETLDDILPEAYAVIREVGDRRLGMLNIFQTEFGFDHLAMSDENRALFQKIQKEIGNGTVEFDSICLPSSFYHEIRTLYPGSVPPFRMRCFDMQLIGAIGLHHGKVIEMKTGEGKTLTAAFPAYLNALSEKGVHVVTVNDYLAERDSRWMGKIHRFMGLTVGLILNHMSPQDRFPQYRADITYGTNNEFGFDYLRDNMVVRFEDCVQTRHNYAIIDEVDSILIDEARTPLIISGPVYKATNKYIQMRPIVNSMVAKQENYINKMLAECTKLLEQESEEAGTRLFIGKKGSPKNERFLRFMEDGKNRRIMETAELSYLEEKKQSEETVLDELYYIIDERGHSIELTEKGRHFVMQSEADLFHIPDLDAQFVEEQDIMNDSSLNDEEKSLKIKETQEKYQEIQNEFVEKSEKIHNISQLLKAYVLFKADVDYVIRENKIVIVDEFTGRLMPGRRYSDGLHSALEAKEMLKVEGENQTLATITLQNYFRMYEKLSGMTGTAETEAKEFKEIYKVDVLVVPTNRPMIRTDFSDVIYKTEKEKFNAVIDKIVERHQHGQPVLVGTVSIEKSEKLGELLSKRGVRCNILNAKHHRLEAEIVANAGQKDSITIATNMAGRGTDIVLGTGVVNEKCRHPKTRETWCCIGCNREERANGCSTCFKNVDADFAQECRKSCKNDAPCGLFIIGTERHESRRIDNQLRGRSGRQGDPGASLFYLSLEDDLMRLFGSDNIANVMERLGMEENEPIEHTLISKAIERAQGRVESRNFQIRKHVLEYDNVMNTQRTVIYEQRHKVLECKDLKEYVMEIIADIIEKYVDMYLHADIPAYDWNYSGLIAKMNYFFMMPFSEEKLKDKNPDEIKEYLFETVKKAYEIKESEISSERMRELERIVLLQTIDNEWKEHLCSMDDLQEGIYLRAHGQRDPLVEYKKEGFELFQELVEKIKENVVDILFKIRLAQYEDVPEYEQQEMYTNKGDEEKRPASKESAKVGRNDPCPCGSGKKYKKCCGA